MSVLAVAIDGGGGGFVRKWRGRLRRRRLRLVVVEAASAGGDEIDEWRSGQRVGWVGAFGDSSL